LAAEPGASVDREMTVLTATAHRDVFARLYPLFLDGILNPGFRQEDFDRLKSRTLEQIEKTLRYSSDEELGKAALNGKVFAGTRYAHLDLGTVAGLNAITMDDVREFHRKYFTRDNVTLALGGAYPPELPGRALADLARLAEGKPAPVPPPAAAPIKGRKVLLVEKPGESTAISFGYPIDLHRGSREYYALWIANSWLGEHRNSVSHLYQVIREARGMNYGDYSYIEAFPQGGFRNMPPTGVGRRQQIFEVWIRPVPKERALFALRAALREVEKLAASGMSREEFESQRSFLKKYVAQFATTTSERLGYAVDDRFYGIEQGHLKQFRRMMDEITLEEVNAAVRKHLRATDLVIAMVTADAQGLKKALLADAPSPIDYGGIEKPAEILKEDKEIERYPLKVKEADITVVPVEEMFTR
jgi:zinc protease